MNETMMLQATALWGGLLGLLMLVLAIVVVIGRNQSKVLLNDGGNDELSRKIRVFGNFTEYVPMIVVLMGIAELTGAPTLAIHIIGGGVFIGRLLHWQGLSGVALKPGRIIGASLTWLALVGAAGYCIMAAV
ncbi:MAPEG family protein [Minwuia sp.]|uniref:MAPEG family protein n=1 Tax=Minwuia sp. TaxID=2493630 RepID=UPI003A8E8C01